MSLAKQSTDHLSTGNRRHAYNDPRRWADADVRKRPNFNGHKHQKAINRLLGTSDGKPIVRLRWAWDVTGFEMGEIRQTYRFYTARLPNGDTCDLSYPRWVYEERFEPGQYMPTWEDVRWVPVLAGERFVGWDEIHWEYDAQGNVRRFSEPRKLPRFEPIYEKVDSLGPPPKDGYYSYLFLIADHDPDQGCCRRAWKAWKRGKRKSMRCWGYYREPGQVDLDRLAKAKAARDAQPFKQSPFAPLSAQTLAEIALVENSWNEEQAKKMPVMASEMWSDHMNAWGHRLDTNDPAVLHHGKYKFFWGDRRFEEKPSGIVTPSTEIETAK
jgi:hypothetical protein